MSRLPITKADDNGHGLDAGEQWPVRALPTFRCVECGDAIADMPCIETVGGMTKIRCADCQFGPVRGGQKVAAAAIILFVCVLVGIVIVVGSWIK